RLFKSGALKDLLAEIERYNVGILDAQEKRWKGNLEKVFDTIPTNDIKIVIGDYKAKIGREENYQDIAGKHCLHTESNNGICRIKFARSRGMVKRGASRVTNVRSFKGANCVSDHHLVKNTVLQAEESTLGQKPQNKKIEWFNQECIEAIQKRNSDRKIFGKADQGQQIKI
ncbi:hypothetical protein J437_LFUL001479, partial [Ladona fulva]